MKKILFAVSLISATGSINAQNIQLKKGQVILTQTSSNTDAEMMMGNMKNDLVMKSKLQVIDETKDGYVIRRTIDALKTNADGMGQSIQFDSEKAEDRNSEIGQMMSKQLSNIDTFSIERSSGLVKSLNSKKADDAGGMMMMASMSSDETQGVSDAFLIVPSGANVGATWTDSMSLKGLKTLRSFKITGINNNIADIEMSAATNGTTENEVQGMTMNMTIHSTIKGMLKVDMSSGLVLTNKNSGDINTDMEVMGQNMQVTTKMSSLTSNTIQ